ncbi:MAG TPA: FecR family protein [Methylophilaceae bacterium]|jgi:hypothetical protein
MKNSIFYGLLISALGLTAPVSVQAAAAVVLNTSGIVSVQRADGSVHALAKNSEVDQGEVITTQKGSYALFKFTDGGQLTLQPETTIKIDQYGFDAAKPEGDSFVFSLIKGGLRSVTGLVGHRGNRDAYKLNTETATIGIRGTDWRGRMCKDNCGGKPNGLYVNVISGIINATNAGGSVDFSTGTFGHIASSSIAPTFLPKDPGVDPKEKEKGKGESSSCVVL